MIFCAPFVSPVRVVESGNGRGWRETRRILREIPPGIVVASGVYNCADPLSDFSKEW